MVLLTQSFLLSFYQTLGSTKKKQGKTKKVYRANKMAENLDLKEMVTLEELLMSNVYAQEALINILEKKVIIDKKELLEEIKRLRALAKSRL